MSPWTVEQRRGHVVEAVHRVHACAVDARGRVLWQVGDDLITTFRSAAKPFQLEVTWGCLPAELRAALDPADLALGAASHHGEAFHIVRLTQLLSKLGRAPRHLFCGVHEPTDHDALRALWASGQQPDVLHNNCSGKHSFMAAATAALGEPEDYRPGTHPLQRAIAHNLKQRADWAALDSVVDGCGLPCFVLPLSRMARCYAQLAEDVQREPREAGVLGQIGHALRAYPRLMSGSQGFDGWLIERAPVIAKVGAQGLVCVAIPEQGIGVAIKLETGADSVRPVAALAILKHAHPEIFSEPLPAQFREVRNVVGDWVGEIVARPPA